MEVDDRSSENEWFLKHETELLDQARREREEREKKRAANESAAALKELRERHWMKCPKCGHDMRTESRSGVDIDICTHCEGIYFEAGELDTFLRQKQSVRRGIIRGLLGM